jgi:hypothetical protein
MCRRSSDGFSHIDRKIAGSWNGGTGNGRGYFLLIPVLIVLLQPVRQTEAAVVFSGKWPGQHLRTRRLTDTFDCHISLAVRVCYELPSFPTAKP